MQKYPLLLCRRWVSRLSVLKLVRKQDLQPRRVTGIIFLSIVQDKLNVAFLRLCLIIRCFLALQGSFLNKLTGFLRSISEPLPNLRNLQYASHFCVGGGGAGGSRSKNLLEGIMKEMPVRGTT